jgi:hypothetical protein
MNQIYYNEQRKQRGCEKLGITSGQWAYIKRVGTMLENLYTNECNGFQDGQGNEDTRATKRNEGNIQHTERLIYMFAGHNGLHVYLQTDPRGASVYLDKKPIQQNRYTDAVCVY